MDQTDYQDRDEMNQAQVDVLMNSPEVPATSDSGESQMEWWDDPGMPWNHKPTRTDIAALAWMGFFGFFSLAMLPLKGWLLGLSPEVTLAISGSRTAAVATGAMVGVGDSSSWWIWAVLIGNLMSIKFDWIYWWAGKLWGRGMLQVWAGKSEKAQRRYEKAESWAKELGWIGMFVAYIPIPIPLMQVVFVLAGSSGMGWKKFMVLDFFASLLSIFGFFLFGFYLGEPAVNVLRAYAKISNYVAIALVVLVFVVYFARSAKKK